MNTRFLYGLLAILAFTGCKTTIEEAEPSSGSADLGSYVALGGSYTAGMTNEALYDEGQQHSLPLILSRLFATAGGGAFKQPNVNSTTGINLDGNSRLELYLGSLCGQPNRIKTRYAASMGDQSIFSNNISGNGPFNNLGIPGIRSTQFNDQFFLNPFYARFASTPGASSILSEAVSVSPTFFTLLIGMEDVFDYARKGGDDLTSVPITEVGLFSAGADEIVNTLTAAGAGGAVGNIPDPSDIPFFRAIPYNGLVLTAAEAQQLNQFYMNDSAIVFSEGANPYLVKDLSVPSKLRMLRSDELVLLSASMDSVCAGYGSYNPATNAAWPFADRHVLDQNELSLVRNRIFSFNDKLRSLASANGLAYADVFAFFRELNKGLVVNGNRYSNEYITGRFFSADGFHPTPQGSALIANLFVEAVNLTYGATLKQADPNAYPGIHLP
jgi:hypothetical protein